MLFTIETPGGTEQAQVAVLDLRTLARRVLVRGGSHAQYVAPGYLVYGTGGTLRAVRFDLARLEVVGTPVPVLEGVATTLLGAAEVSVAADGTLVYRPALGATQGTLVWLDRKGREESLGVPPRPYVDVRLSPDGTHVAVSIGGREREVWLWDLGMQQLSRLTVGGGNMPVWTPDGQRVIWTSGRAGVPNLYMQAADGTGEVERLTNSPNFQRSSSLTPDGKQVLLWEDQAGRGTDLMLLNLEGRMVTPLVATSFNESHGEVSPDGEWLAYESNETGRYEVYVRPFPSVEAGKWPISNEGGVQPIWARSGRELFYRGKEGAVMAVQWEAKGGRFTASRTTKLVDGPAVGGGAFRLYDVAPDGSRFLMMKQGENSTAATNVIVVVEHWDEELKRLLPPK